MRSMQGFNPYFDPYKEVEELTKFIRNAVYNSGSKGCVVGVSGGIDSAVAVLLCRRAFPDGTIGVLLPTAIQKYSFLSSYTRALVFLKQNNITHCEYEVSFPYIPIDNSITPFDSITPLDKGNFVARLRMTYLYMLASIHDYLVVGTDNLSENYVGYFTKYGDGGVDLNPLGQYFKSEVYILGHFLEVTEDIINASPTAELWEGQTDEDELGMSYDDLEWAIRSLKSGDIDIKSKRDYSIIEKVKKLHSLSYHKREIPPEYQRRGNQ